MEKQTHYQLLNVDKNVSTDIIKLAYERLLRDAKEKLENSPLYFEKEKKLNEAYQVLSNTQRRQFYDKKLLQQRIESQNNIENSSESFNLFNFISHLFFSRIFWGSGALILVLLIIFPDYEENTNNQSRQKTIENYYNYQNQQVEYMRQKEEFYSASQNNYQESVDKRRQERKAVAEKRQLEREIQNIEREEQRAIAKIEREERRLQLNKDRAEKNAALKLQRQENREKSAREKRQRQQRYTAEKRSRELIRNQQQDLYLQKRKEKITSANLK
ncbi:MAG: DnaJ domain-containing protein [Pseudomonadota bacterium]